MPLVPCPDCAHSDNPKRCRHCRGTGLNLDPISGIFTAAAASAAGIRDKCPCCGGDGQCKTCGGRGKVPDGAHSSSPTVVESKERTAQQSQARNRFDTSHEDLRSSDKPAAAVGGGGFGGGGGGEAIGDLLASFTEATGVPWPAFVILVVVGSFLGWLYKKPPQYSLDIVVYDAAHYRPIKFLDYERGQKQRITLSVTWQGGLQYTDKQVTLELLRDGDPVFNKQFKAKDTGANELSLPFVRNFAAGHYLARVSADGVPPREYDFSVGDNRKVRDIVGGINLGDPPVQPVVETGLTIYVSDSFLGSHPWPPKNVIYAVSGEPKWLYAVVQSDASVSSMSVHITVGCGAALPLSGSLSISPNSMAYQPLKEILLAGHCAERVFLENGTHVEFPFIVVEVEHGSKPEEYKIVHDPDAEPPNLSSAWLQRGMEHSRTGQHDAAIRDFSVDIPDETVAYQLRGNEYAELGNYERAITDYDVTLQRQPHNVSCLVSRGSAYANLRNYKLAIVDFKEAIRINPQYQIALEHLARAKKDLTAQQAVAISPENALDSSPDATESVPSLGCYIGEWHDNVGNLWIFTQAGDDLNLHRPSDGSTGTFRWTGTKWQGSVTLPRMKIVSGEFTLQSLDDSCTRLKTSMAMYFVRRLGK